MRRYVLLLLIFFGFTGVSGQIVSSSIRYTIKPVPAADRTNLEISVRFKAESGDFSKIQLPTDTFGVPDIHRYVSSFEGEDGTVVKPGKTDVERLVKPAADGRVSIRYVLSYDDGALKNYPYSPNVGPGHFHVAGCQWLLHIGDDNKKNRISVEIVEAPKNWKLYSSISPLASKFETTASYDDLSSSGIGGGSRSYLYKGKKSRPFSVFISGKFDIPDKEIARAAERIVISQRKWFEDDTQPFFTISINQRDGVVAGYAPDNAFFCFIRSDISRDELNLLLAHELFHSWLPNKIQISQDKKYSDIRYEWFYEGFTDYFARKILLETGLITPEKYMEFLNKDILNVADNPHRAETYDQLMAAAKEGRFDGVYKKLSYFRGALIALKWDMLIRRGDGKRSLSDLIREAYVLAGKTGGKIPEQAFQDLSKGFGIDAQADLEQYIMRGEAIEILPAIPIKGFELNEVEHPVFDLGFLLDLTRRTKKMSGVVENGPAYRAGLRDGMEFVSAQNANRSSNSWRADKPSIIVVKVDQEERTFEFFPHGNKIKLKLFSKVK